MPEITTITSESLQQKVRDLLPSQRGFGIDLEAQNVIVPTIDLTAAAQGTDVPLYQQQAFAFGSITAFSANNATVTVANTPGFFRVLAQGVMQSTSGLNGNLRFSLTDGVSTKIMYTAQLRTATGDVCTVTPVLDFTVFLAAGESLTATTGLTALTLAGCVRQTADVNGNAINPSGFTPQ